MDVADCAGLLTLCLLSLFAADHAESQQPDIRTGVSLVVAPVSVTDRKGIPIQALDKPDFAVFVDGKPQPFELDEPIAPLSMVAAVESSDLAAAALAKIRKVGSLLEPVLAGQNGDVAVISFDRDVRVIRAFGDSLSPRDAFAGLKSGGSGSATTDAVMEAAGLLAARPPGHRKAILLIGEAKDRGSKARLPDAITALQRDNIELYSLTYSPYLTPFTARPEDAPQTATSPDLDLGAVFSELGRAGRKSTVAAISAATGGEHLSFLRKNGLEDAIQRIGLDIHSQYILSFSPRDRSPGFHQIEVQVVSRPEATIRARQGYWIAEKP
jgi:VWFA-related protein